MDEKELDFVEIDGYYLSNKLFDEETIMKSAMRITIAALLGLAFFMLLMAGWAFVVDLVLPHNATAANVRGLAPGAAIVLIILGVKIVAAECRIAKQKKTSNQASHATSEPAPGAASSAREG